MKICLGGSFNPIHHGHLICARAVAEHMGADGIVLIPTAQSPHKTVGELAPVADRMRMCLLAVQGTDMFEVDDREIRRGERSYTIDNRSRTARRRVGWCPLAHRRGYAQYFANLERTDRAPGRSGIPGDGPARMDI